MVKCSPNAYEEHEASGRHRHETGCKRESDLVVFDQERSLIFDKETGEVNCVREERENLLFDEWITPLGESTFGQRRWSMATNIGNG